VSAAPLPSVGQLCRKEEIKIRGTFSMVVHPIINRESSLVPIVDRFLMQRFYGNIVRHELGGISVSQTRPKPTRLELDGSRRRLHDAETGPATVLIATALASPSPDWLGAVRRRGLRRNGGPVMLSQNHIRLRSREARTTLRIDWCLGEARPIPIRVEKTPRITGRRTCFVDV
jgi:hypothetical protein